MSAMHKPIHPGEILKEEFLKPMGITMYRLCRETGMPADRVSRIVAGTRSISGDTALRLARFFGTTPVFWLNLQSRFDLVKAEQIAGKAIEKTVKPWKAA